jgi:hypothetical protein
MKKQRAVLIQIPEPCRVPWQEMRQVDEYRHHCASCATVVTDFSEMSDLEIAAFIQANAGKKMCGKFNASQLNRPVALLPEQKRKAVWWKAALLLPFTFLGKTTHAQNNEPQFSLSVEKQDSLNQDTFPVSEIPVSSYGDSTNEQSTFTCDTSSIAYETYIQSITTDSSNAQHCQAAVNVLTDTKYIGVVYGNMVLIDDSKFRLFIQDDFVAKTLGITNLLPKQDTPKSEISFIPPPSTPEPKPENPLPPEQPTITALTPPEQPRFSKRSTNKN